MGFNAQLAATANQASSEIHRLNRSIESLENRMDVIEDKLNRVLAVLDRR